jgi:MFS family permease
VKSSSPALPLPRSPALLVIMAEGFLSRLSFGIIGFALPLFAYRRLGLSLTQTGFLFSLNLIVEQLFKPVMGWVADRVGLKRSFTAAIALRSLVALLLTFATSPWHVYAVRMLHGFSESLRDPSVSALIAEYADKRKMAAAFGWYSSLKMSAGSLGRALGGWLLWWTADEYGKLFLLAFALSFLPLYVVARYLREPVHSEPQPHSNEATSPATPATKAAEQAAEPKASFLSVVILGSLITSTAMMISNLFPVLATEYAHLNAAQAGLIYTIAPVVTIIAGPAFGWLADNVSQRLVLLVRSLANICSSLLFWFWPTFAGMAAGNVIDAAGKAAFRPAWGVLMARAASLDRQRRARVMSYFGLGEGIGETIGPLLGGFLWGHFGVGVMLSVRVVMAVIAEVYAVIVARKTTRPEQTREAPLAALAAIDSSPVFQGRERREEPLPESRSDD